MNLREFLAQKEKYPDNHKVQLADGVEVTLGDLRTYSAERETEAQHRLEELSQRENALSQAANEVAELKARLEAMAATPGASADPEVKELLDLLKGVRNGNKVDIFKEPGDYFKPLVDRLTTLDESIKSNQTALKAQRDDLEKTLIWHAKKQIDRDYRSFKDWPKDFDVRKAVSYATQNRLVDEMGYPDFDKVYERVTAPIRNEQTLEADRKKIREEERKKAQDEARTQRAGREPFVSLPNGGGSGTTSGGKKYGGIEKVSEADILSDPEILETFTNNTGS